MRHYLGQDYWVSFGYFRVFFPFNQRRNSPSRHRWYDIGSPDYAAQRDGIIHGLLRNHIMQQRFAVESLWDVNRLVAREKLLKLKTADPEQQKELEEFFKVQAEVEEKLKHAEEEASSDANQVRELEKQNGELHYKAQALQTKLEAAGPSESGVSSAKIFPTLPSSLVEVAEAAGRTFPRLVITENALKTAGEFPACKCVAEAWEMLVHLQECMWKLKFEADGQADWKRTFREKTCYDLAISEGRETQGDAKLMRLRKLVHDGREDDITPHVKHGNAAPKMVRIILCVR